MAATYQWWLMAPIDRDTGCDLAPSCLACPLPACRYDLPPKVAAALPTIIAVRRLRAAGKTVTETAEELGVSRRTAFRLSARRPAAVEALVALAAPELARGEQPQAPGGRM